MSVDIEHPEYANSKLLWQMIRDCIAGDHAVKDNGQSYLAKPTGMSFTEYNVYLDRALFYNATARTVQFLIGSLFRRELQVTDFPERHIPLLNDVTLMDQSLQMLAKQIGEELIAVGRVGVAVDFNEEENKPYLAMYTAENIKHWDMDYIGGTPVLNQVILAEWRYEKDPKKEFEYIDVERRRVLYLNDSGQFAVEVWEKSAEKHRQSDFVHITDEDAIPSIRGRPLDFIPFQFININNLLPDVDKPPLLDLCQVNISHFKNSADLEHGIHMTALPTPWIAGDLVGGQEERKELRIGSGTAWHLEQGAQVGMLEFTGAGLEAIANRMKQKEDYMAFLGSRLLANQKAGVEAAYTVQMRHTGDNSVLASIADTMGQGLAKCLDWYLMWLGQMDADVGVEINKDFIAQPMSSEELKSLVAAWQAGAFGDETLFFNLQKGEIIPEGKSYDDFSREMEEAEAKKLAMFQEGMDATQNNVPKTQGNQEQNDRQGNKEN